MNDTTPTRRLGTGELDRITNAARRAKDAAAITAVSIRTGRTQEAERQVLVARDASAEALRLSVEAGGKDPGAIRMPELPLHLLDTPTGRRALAAVEAAQRACAELDLERGWIDGDGSPCGYGETLSGMALRMQNEIHGPVGRE